MEYQKITKNNSETVTNKNDKEMPKEIPKARYIYLLKKSKILLII